MLGQITTMGKSRRAKPRSRRPHFESLTLEEVQELLRSTDRIEIRALFELALTTGIRRADIVDIEIERVNLKKRHIDFWEQKKERMHRVFLEPDVVTTLRMYIRTLPKEQKLLFKFRQRTAYNYLQKYLERAHIQKRLRFHDLRTTFIRLSRKLGRSIKYVMQQTGDTAQVILEHYEHMTDEEMHQVTNKGILKASKAHEECETT